MLRGSRYGFLPAVDHPDIKVRREDHTDNVAWAQLNRTLSKNRAASVVTWLVKHGIDPSRLRSEGFGPDRPIDDNRTYESRKNNRRVEFHILEEPGAPPAANPLGYALAGSRSAPSAISVSAARWRRRRHDVDAGAIDVMCEQTTSTPGRSTSCAST